MIQSNIKSGYFKDFQWIDFLCRSIPVLMGIFIFFNPFPHTTSIKEIIFYPTVVIVFALVFFKKIEFSFKTPLLLPFSLFVFWAFLNLFFALDKANSVHDFLAHLLKYIIFYYILINFFSSKKRLTVLAWTIIISATIYSLGAFFSWYIILGKPLLSRFGDFKSAGTTINGFITIFALILSLYHFRTENILYRKVILIISIFSLFIASLLAQSRGTLIAMAIAITLLCCKNKKVLIPFIMVVLIFVANAPIKSRLLNSSEYDIRIGLIYYSIEIIKDYPVFGTGFAIDTFRDVERIDPQKYMARIPEKYRIPPHPYLWPHNMLLSIGVRLGFAGIVLFLYVLTAAAKMCWNLIRFGKDDFIKNWGVCILSVFVMFCVKGLFDPVFTHFVDVIFYTILSMVTILWRLNESIAVPVVVDFNESDKENK